jgi:DNA invertase Pin-like site-specific DNA recombinase
MKKYIAYVRVSTKKQERSGLSMDAQKAIIEHYANIEQAEIIKVYLESVSGKDLSNRPKLQEAMQDCKKSGGVLVVAKLDRLSRNVKDIFTIIEQLGEGNFKSCDLPSTDTMTLSVFAGIAQRERELISIRTKLALKEKKKQGVKLGTPKNLTQEARRAGALANKKKAQETTSNKIAYSIISAYRKDGISYQKIADELNGSGLRTARGKDYQRSTVKMIYDRFLVANS